jgi:hypothetical protein
MSAARIFRVGLVDVDGITCRHCGKPVEPRDVERQRSVDLVVRGICAGCHANLFCIEFESPRDRENFRVNAESSRPSRYTVRK